MTVEGMGGPLRGLGSGLRIPPPTTRRVFFSFHYQQDIWRVQQIRHHWVTKPNRESAGYFDGSLEEKAKTEGSLAVKRLINSRLNGCSVTCVLIGSYTYSRHWVHYEIFKSIEAGMGVLGVRIHKMKTQFGREDTSGANPFDCLGYGSSPSSKLVPHVHTVSGWQVYKDADPISPSSAKYLRTGTKPILSSLFQVYDWVEQSGYENFAAWVAAAAAQAGR